jgi:hypothetical protein
VLGIQANTVGHFLCLLQCYVCLPKKHTLVLAFARQQLNILMPVVNVMASFLLFLQRCLLCCICSGLCEISSKIGHFISWHDQFILQLLIDVVYCFVVIFSIPAA